MCLTIELGPRTIQLLNGILSLKQTVPKANRFMPQKTRIAPEPSFPALDINLQAQLEELIELVRTMRTPVIEKEFYSVDEVAERTQREGVTKYNKFTIRQACNLGRIPGAKKSHTGCKWLIPYEAVKRILNEGLPPPSPHAPRVP